LVAESSPAAVAVWADRDVPASLSVSVTKSEASAGETILDQVEVVDVARTWLAAQAVPSVLEPLFQPGGRASPAA